MDDAGVHVLEAALNAAIEAIDTDALRAMRDDLEAVYGAGPVCEGLLQIMDGELILRG